MIGSGKGGYGGDHWNSLVHERTGGYNQLPGGDISVAETAVFVIL